LNCFAITPPGAEYLCAKELETLGIKGEVQPGGVAFCAMLRDLYRVNLWSRVASRVLVRLAKFRCRDFPELYRQALRLPWGRYLRAGQPFQVRVSSRASRLNHSGRVSDSLRAAIEKALPPPSSAQNHPQLIFVRFDQDQCMISVDSSGELLHFRGYRQAAVAAPLRENLAAAMLLKLGYDGSQPLIDAMCGSGTLAIEAALIATGIPPGRLRSFSFMHWPHYRPHVWTLCLQEQGRPVPPMAVILANDLSPQALEANAANAARAGVGDWLQLHQGRAEELKAPASAGILLCNPPYGERLGQSAQLLPWYKALGHSWREAFPSWHIGWICVDPGFARAMHLDCRRLWSFSNGGIKAELRHRAGKTAVSP
jgi:putative N6-adenine-specific DNA methylase